MVFVLNAFFQIPSSSFRKKRKEIENEKKNISDLQKKTKANVDIDFFALIKGQWKVREFSNPKPLPKGLDDRLPHPPAPNPRGLDPAL